MNHLGEPSSSKQDLNFEDDEIFEDSAFLANFDNTSFKQTNVSTDNLNNSVNTSALNVSALCCDEEISGYDKLTGRTWIYPTNYPVRDYQFNIINTAILKNTLVSLPTGLGKTFIAAVIMYNFYRWYPLGKIVFAAPTRPLVAQQITACYNIIAIPPNDTIEMTGHMQVNTRKAHWQTKRVFFATPQVIYNDLKAGICPANKIRCLVFDEAHKARGNYAYCQIVATLDDMGCKTYRMLALSATPGSRVDDVINVVRNLHIAHLELRTENCIDVAPYSHSRKINTEIVKLGPQLTQLRQQYVEILDFYARRLKQFNILPQNLGNLSKGRIVMLYKEYQSKDRGSRHPQHNYIMKDFTLLIALYHGLELLVKHGSRVFLNFFDEHPEKTWIQSDDKLTAMLERLRDDLGVNPMSLDRSILPDGSIPEMPKDLCFGHPKFDRLKAIIVDHFTRAKEREQDTRAIIFCEYRESVNLVHCLLLQCRPLILPQMFVGQGASGKEGKTLVSQKQQLRVMRTFREGLCNTLVATCVAEEGLDVGSVDLIICFDISTSSPIRLVQRCGRTGRERGGQVYILVTEGREHQTLMDCMRQRDGLNKKILQSKDVRDNLYQLNPRMMPHGFTPECHKMYITVAKKIDSNDKEKSTKKGQKSLRTMLLNRASGANTSLTKEDNSLITDEDFKNMFPEGYPIRKPFRGPANFWAMNKESLKTQAMKSPGRDVNLSKWLDWQRTLQKTVIVNHSKDSEFLVNILQKCDAKRLEPTQNIVPVNEFVNSLGPVANTQELPLSRPVSPIPMPLSQIRSPIKTPVKTTKQTKKKKIPANKSPAKNCGDIRALFCTTTKSTKNYTKIISDLGVQNDGSVSTRLINLLVDLNLNVDSTNTKNCYICENVCDCKKLQNMGKSDDKPNLVKFLRETMLPDINLIEDIDADTLKKSSKEMNASRSFGHVLDTSIKSTNDKNNSNNFDLDFDLDAIDELKSPEAKVTQNKVENVSNDKNFDIGNIDDILVISSPEEALEPQVANECEVKDKAPAEKALNYFGLDSLDDIFADYEDDVREHSKELNKEKEKQTPKKESGQISKDMPIPNIKNPNKVEPFQDKNMPNMEYPLSPSILSGRQKVRESKDLPTSPILCSQMRRPLSIKKKILQSSTPNSTARKKLSLSHDHAKTSSSISDADKSMFTVTQLVEMINKSDKSLNKTNSSENFATNERSGSPILLTQSEKKTSNKNDKVHNNKSESLIILSSDDSSDTVDYDFEEIDNIISQTSKAGVKRKPETDEITSSPHFNKKLKLDNSEASRPKPLTVQEKILAAIISNKAKSFTNNQANFNFIVTQPNFSSQKENKVPQIRDTYLNNSPNEKIMNHNPLDILEKFRKVNETQKSKYDLDKSLQKTPEKVTKRIFEDTQDFILDDRLSPKINGTNKECTTVKRNTYFGESDDDFIDDKKGSDSPRPAHKAHKRTTNHKVRKKKRKGNSFIEMEASLSDDNTDSGDELTDDSAGSIAEFICDDADITRQGDNIHALYLKSVRSPVKKNGFKIPELPEKYKREDIFSQFVEEDAYEMDSFCVDSHIGLTQVNDVSELELAEIILERKRKSKKAKQSSPVPEPNCDSPMIRKTKKTSRQINSDSDDSS